MDTNMKRNEYTPCVVTQLGAEDQFFFNDVELADYCAGYDASFTETHKLYDKESDEHYWSLRRYSHSGRINELERSYSSFEDDTEATHALLLSWLDSASKQNGIASLINDDTSIETIESLKDKLSDPRNYDTDEDKALDVERLATLEAGN